MVDRQWIKFTKQAQKDAKKLTAAGLKPKAKQLLEILKHNPFTNSLGYEKLQGDFKDAYSRRINVQHRLVYQVLESENTIKILRMWSHYGD